MTIYANAFHYADEIRNRRLMQEARTEAEMHLTQLVRWLAKGECKRRIRTDDPMEIARATSRHLEENRPRLRAMAKEIIGSLP